jgi:ribose-phosphate pyrophosphokinase
LLDDIRSRFSGRVVIVSPDAGGTERARAFAKRLDAGLAIIDKRRSGPNVSEVMHIIGEVKGETCIIVDDMIDTAGTLCQAASALKQKGAGDVYATATHAVLSGPALERINQSELKEVLITNTIPSEAKLKECPQLRIISVAKLLAEAIRRIHGDESVSSLFV